MKLTVHACNQTDYVYIYMCKQNECVYIYICKQIVCVYFNMCIPAHRVRAFALQAECWVFES